MTQVGTKFVKNHGNKIELHYFCFSGSHLSNAKFSINVNEAGKQNDSVPTEKFRVHKKIRSFSPNELWKLVYGKKSLLPCSHVLVTGNSSMRMKSSRQITFYKNQFYTFPRCVLLITFDEYRRVSAKFCYSCRVDFFKLKFIEVDKNAEHRWHQSR